jgi:hypothetical protein
MAYFIFLNYLDSLKDFRKIPMSKFIINLLVQIFKVLPNSRIQIKIQNGFYLILAHPVSSAKQHSLAQEAFRPRRPSRPSPSTAQAGPSHHPGLPAALLPPPWQAC